MIVAISGVKNSGKTTLTVKLIQRFVAMGLKVATIKHDGHEFDGDVEGTDTYRQSKAGAYGTAIFSAGQFMVKKKTSVTETDLIRFFPEADLILLEGFKTSEYPKIELIREGNSSSSVCNPKGLFAIATNKKEFVSTLPVLPLDDTIKIAECIIMYFKNRGENK